MPNDSPPTTEGADLETDLFAFLQRKYTQHQDERQKTMGLVYMEAETHNLAREVARWVEWRYRVHSLGEC